GGKVTRAEFAVFLGRALGLDESANDGVFSDVGAGTYYSGYVNTMSKLGLITGNSDGTFGPNDSITREQLAAMVIRAYTYATGVKAGDVSGANGASFADLGKASSYATESIKAAKALGIIDGTGTGNFEPAGNATREQAAKMIMELLGNME
ncbi:MAG: S-layer homology domain-containing protein, partial [Candidatus Pristimantibacillus sp.]